MSLINQMLQDLEQRNASAGKVEPISGEVRAIPAPGQSRPAMVVGGVVVSSLIVAATAGWMYFRTSESNPKVTVAAVPAQKSTPPAVPAAVPPLPQPVAEPVAAVVAESPTVSPEPVIQQETATPMPGLETRLPSPPKLSSSGSAEKTGKPTADSGRSAVQSATTAAVAENAAQSPGAEPPPLRQKPVPRSVPGSAGTALKTVSPTQQSDNLYRQAIAALQQGRVAEAQELLQKSLGTNPANLKARQVLVGVLVEGKHNEEAIGLLQSGLKLSPEQSGFSMALARLQVETGDRRGGIETLEHGLQYAGEDADYHAFYAALLQHEERHEEAVSHYLTALRSNPAMPTWLVGIGISLQAQGKLVDAQAAYQRAKDGGQLTPELSRFVEQRLKQVAQQH